GCVLHSLGVRLAAKEALAALLEPQARTQLLQRAWHIARPALVGKRAGGELCAALPIPRGEGHGEACVVAPIAVRGRQVLDPELPRLDLCGVHLLPPYCCGLRLPTETHHRHGTCKGKHKSPLRGRAVPKGRPNARPIERPPLRRTAFCRLYVAGLRRARGDFFVRLSVEMPRRRVPCGRSPHRVTYR